MAGQIASKVERNGEELLRRLKRSMNEVEVP
jgi:hypothetical protein